MGFSRKTEGKDYSPEEVQRNILEGLVWAYAAFDEHARDESASKNNRLSGIQNALDAGFNIAIRMEDPNEKLIFLLKMGRNIDLLLDFVRSSPSYGPALYYAYKHLDFIAGTYRTLNNFTESVKFFKHSLRVWEEMDSLGSYGSGNGVMDPYVEGCSTLFTIAELICIFNTGDYAEGIAALQRSINFYEYIWLKEGMSPPLKRQASYIQDLVMLSNCEVKRNNYEVANNVLRSAIGII
jgi:tetratricopeptide (TPR) repeat protein